MWEVKSKWFAAGARVGLFVLGLLVIMIITFPVMLLSACEAFGASIKDQCWETVHTIRRLGLFKSAKQEAVEEHNRLYASFGSQAQKVQVK